MSALTPRTIFDTLAGAAPVAYALSVDETIVFWSRGAEQVLGYSAERVVGLRYRELAGASVNFSHLERSLAVQQVKQGLLPMRMRVEMQCASGDRRAFRLVPVVVSEVLGGQPMVVCLLHEWGAEGDADVNPEDEGNQERRYGVVATGGRGNLSARQLQVLLLVGAGMTTRDIAAHLGVSLATVLNHVRNVRKKLGAKTKLEAVSIALNLGLIRVD